MRQASYTDTISSAPVTAPSAPGIAKAVANVVGAVFGRLCHWQNRYVMRQKMATFDDRILDDIGLSRARVTAEAEKPFWKG